MYQLSAHNAPCGGGSITASAPGQSGAAPYASTRSSQAAAQAKVLRSSRRLGVARALWIIIAFVAIALFSGGVFARYTQLTSPYNEAYWGLARLNMPVDFYTTYNLSFEIICALGFIISGLVIFVRSWRTVDKDDGVLVSDWMGLYASISLIIFGTAAYPVLPTMQALSIAQPETVIPVRLFTFAAWTSILVLFYIFPDGRCTPRWTKVAIILTIALEIPWHLAPDSFLSPRTWTPPLRIATIVAVWATPVIAQIYRYTRMTDPEQRQQTKWAVYGIVVGVITGVTFFLVPLVNTELGVLERADSLAFSMVRTAVMHFSALIIPVMVAVSVMRYRLWAIDRIINRTLVYVPLTGLLAGLYAASVSLSQKMFIYITGDTSDAAIIFSALLLATVFTPVRNGLQGAVDRRFKETPDPTKRLKELREQVGNVVEVLDTRRASFQLVAEATQAFDAEGGAVYLHSESDGSLEPIYTTEGWGGDAQISVPLEYNSIHYGLVALGARRNGYAYTSEDKAILQEVANTIAEAMALVSQLK